MNVQRQPRELLTRAGVLASSAVAVADLADAFEKADDFLATRVPSALPPEVSPK